MSQKGLAVGIESEKGLCALPKMYPRGRRARRAKNDEERELFGPVAGFTRAHTFTLRTVVTPRGENEKTGSYGSGLNRREL